MNQNKSLHNPWGTLQRKDISVAEKASNLFQNESLHYPREKLGRDISVEEKIFAIIIQKDRMFALSTGVTRERRHFCCRKNIKSEMFKMFTLSKWETRKTLGLKICQIYFRMKVCIIKVETMVGR